MDGLLFESAPRSAPADPARADVALFVGFVERRPVPARRPREADASYLQRALPASLLAWFVQAGWWSGSRPLLHPVEQLVALEDLPVPIDHWDAFDALFAWDQRPLDDSGRVAHTTLGSAVRRFFAEGGRKAYVVRLGPPWPVRTAAVDRARVGLAGLTRGLDSLPTDRGTWSGLGHVLGLEEVSFLVTPDLPELFAVDPEPPRRDLTPRVPEVFVECGDHPVPPTPVGLRAFPEPRCDAEGFRNWASWVVRVGGWLARYAREAQFLGALPLPVKESNRDLRAARQAQWTSAARVQSAFVQLAYPWVRTRESPRLPGDLEPPDALLAGTLARNALTRGTWRPVSREVVANLRALEPVPDRADLERLLNLAAARPGAPSARRARDHVTWVGPSPTGFRWLSDVTTDDDEVYRPANVSRLMSALVRATRRAGETLVFARNGEALWGRVIDVLSRLLSELWSEGALAGASAAEAFEVRCDRSTMTQADLDAGRVIVRVQFTTSVPIQQITVVLALADGGLVSLLSKENPLTSGAPA